MYWNQIFSVFILLLFVIWDNIQSFCQSIHEILSRVSLNSSLKLRAKSRPIFKIKVFVCWVSFSRTTAGKGLFKTSKQIKYHWKQFQKIKTEKRNQSSNKTQNLCIKDCLINYFTYILSHSIEMTKKRYQNE